MYFDILLKKIKNNESIFENIINPFSLYFIADHYYGNELNEWNLNNYFNKNNILISNNISLIKDYDIVHVQVNFFEKFCNEILDKIDKKIILATGQCHAYQIEKSIYTEKVLNNKNIVLWISQNPIYEDIDKYVAFPYGILHLDLYSYAIALLNFNFIKDKNVIHLSLNHATNPCRKKLPILPHLPRLDFYKEISKSKFLISPIGDRDDCYRHYEAIGLGTIPISNIGKQYKKIFGNNMHYTDIDDMVNIVNSNIYNFEYKEPNKDLICFDYYKDMVYSLIDKIKNNI